MSRLPRLTGKQLIKVLKKTGFEVIRIKGSHHFLRHSDGRSTVVPVHSGETSWSWTSQSDLKGLRPALSRWLIS